MNAETRYIADCYGLIADTPMHRLKRGEEIATCLTCELCVMIGDGWQLVKS